MNSDDNVYVVLGTKEFNKTRIYQPMIYTISSSLEEAKIIGEKYFQENPNEFVSIEEWKINSCNDIMSNIWELDRKTFEWLLE